MNNSLIGIVMLVCGLMLTVGGVTLLVRKDAGPIEARKSVATETPRGRVSQPVEVQPTSQEKGEAFEKWVVKKFSPNYFDIKDWRGDKFVEGRYAESSEHPDLVIEFKLREIRSPFAVECKWRRTFEHREQAGMTWASERQIANYQRFSVDRKMPVFVVIGVGGEPDAPAELYVIPLAKLKYPWANAEYLAKFRRAKLADDFYYDYKKPDLR